MGPETIWIFIPLAAMGIAAMGMWLKHREKEMELLSQQNTEKAAQYAAQNERLEQRVQVLERIITDKSNSLSDAIEDLRDKPLN
jgi:predicted nuclease with TOPRIM domain